MKYIFLDIDGVLNCSTGVYTFLHKDKVKILADIVKETNAEIILISSWKSKWFSQEKHSNGAHAKVIDSVFAEFGISVADKTNDNNSWQRGKGIREYLGIHPAKSWVILDDDFFPDYNQYGCDKHLIRTSFSTGLTEELKGEIIKMLNS